MKIAIIGTGYVGFPPGAGLTSLGHRVTCVDCIPEKIEKLRAGKVTLHKEGLEDLLKGGEQSGRLAFTEDMRERRRVLCLDNNFTPSVRRTSRRSTSICVLSLSIPYGYSTGKNLLKYRVKKATLSRISLFHQTMRTLPSERLALPC